MNPKDVSKCPLCGGEMLPVEDTDSELVLMCCQECGNTDEGRYGRATLKKE